MNAVLEFIKNLFGDEFMPHGHCYFWKPEILWTGVVGDALTTLAYMIIPLSLFYFVRNREDIKFKWIFMLFGAFIMVCGATHLIAIITVWEPIYRFEVIVKMLTGIISVITAAYTIKLMPEALKIPSVGRLEATNKQLTSEMKERIEAEKTLNEYKEELEHRVEERTKELEKSNKELESFAYITSHDLKAPLRAISSLAGFLNDDYKNELDEEGKKQLQMLKSRVNRMDELIDGILQFSRVGRKEGEEEEIDVKSLLEESIELIAPPDNFHIEIETEMPVLKAKKVRLVQVFENLISNAVKYNDKRRGEIKIGAKDKGEMWEFYVSDNGPGIEEKYRKKIFEIFQTLNARDDVESTGIGLAIVKKIIENSKGEIRVESEKGKGSTFYFTWPKK